MKLILALALTVVFVALAGCVEEPLPTEATASLQEVGPPPASGIITREGKPVAYTWVDSDTGMRIVVGADMNEFCSGFNNFDIVPYHEANLPDGRLVSLGKGALQTTVWDFLVFDCALFTTEEPVASGRANFMEVDNDLFGIADGDKNTNTWAYSARGRLSATDGGTVQLNAFIRQQFGNDGGFKVIRKVALR